jgi:1-acyl-sn-glycerol-3-phosphate acyltransferase
MQNELMRLFPIYRWGVIAPFLALTTLVLGVIIIVISALGFPNFASRVFATAWARLNMAVSLMTIDIIGSEKVDPHTSYVIVANHQSLVDIYVLYGYLLQDIKWVMKKELRAIPVFGQAAQAMNHIIIDRSNSEAAIKSINDSRDKLKDGISVVFFPEGTRSRNGELRTFKKGAFRLAQELGIPILPVTIHNTVNVLPSDTTDIVPGHVKMEYGDPIPTEGLISSDINALANQSRDVIAAALEREKGASDAA